MKKLVSIFLAIFGLVAIVCAHGYNGNNNYKSTLNLKLWNHSAFSVVFDNHTFSKSTQFDLANINPGIHHIQVIKLTPNHNGYGGLKRVLYNGTINIPKNALVKAIVDKKKGLEIKVFKNNHGHNNYYSNNDDYFFDDFNSYPHSDHSCNNNYNGDNYGFNDDLGWNNNPYYNPQPMVMPGASFRNLVRIVNNTSFDATKLIIVKQALRDNFFTTEQVAILMDQFSFDSHKLAMAKVAYEKTVDKENYFMLNEQFAFNSSVEELNQYLSNFT